MRRGGEFEVQLHDGLRRDAPAVGDRYFEDDLRRVDAYLLDVDVEIGIRKPMPKRVAHVLALQPPVAEEEALVVGAGAVAAGRDDVVLVKRQRNRQMAARARRSEQHVRERVAGEFAREEDEQARHRVVVGEQHGPRRERDEDRGRRRGDCNEERLLVEGEARAVRGLRRRRAAARDGDVRGGRRRERRGDVVRRRRDHVDAARAEAVEHGRHGFGEHAAAAADDVVVAEVPAPEQLRGVLERGARGADDCDRRAALQRQRAVVLQQDDGVRRDLPRERAVFRGRRVRVEVAVRRRAVVAAEEPERVHGPEDAGRHGVDHGVVDVAQVLEPGRPVGRVLDAAPGHVDVAARVGRRVRRGPVGDDEALEAEPAAEVALEQVRRRAGRDAVDAIVRAHDPCYSRGRGGLEGRVVALEARRCVDGRAHGVAVRLLLVEGEVLRDGEDAAVLEAADVRSHEPRAEVRVLAAEVLGVAAAGGDAVHVDARSQHDVRALGFELARGRGREAADEAFVPTRRERERARPRRHRADHRRVRRAEALARVLHLERRDAEPRHGARVADVVAREQVPALPAVAVEQAVLLLARHGGDERSDVAAGRAAAARDCDDGAFHVASGSIAKWAKFACRSS